MSISIPVGFRPIGRPREREAARTRHGRAPALTLTGDSGRGTAGPPRSCCRCGLDCSGSGWEGAAARPTPSMDPCICDAASFVRCCSIGPGDLPGSLVAGGTYCCEAGSLLRPAAACPVSCPRAAPLLLLADSAAARWCPTAGESSVLGAILPFPPGCQTSWPDEHFESIWISTEQQGMGHCEARAPALTLFGDCCGCCRCPPGLKSPTWLCRTSAVWTEKPSSTKSATYRCTAAAASPSVQNALPHSNSLMRSYPGD